MRTTKAGEYTSESKCVLGFKLNRDQYAFIPNNDVCLMFP